jgi:hypothetical protein
MIVQALIESTAPPHQIGQKLAGYRRLPAECPADPRGDWRQSKVTMPKRKGRLNLEIVRSNIAEAIEELQKLEDHASTGDLHEEELQVGLCHAYHHLNFAWNIRRVATREYANLSKTQFDEWGRYPSDIEQL